MPESCQQKTPASGCPLDTPSLPFPSGRYSALSLLPAKGTIQPNIASQIRYMFQSTHPRGVRPYVQHFSSRGERFQSTHPRGVRRITRAILESYCHVSIHAPARGATKKRMCNSPTSLGFNPRTREGCDFRMSRISSHWALFQSTHPRGVRRTSHPFGTAIFRFQSTHPRGVRPRERRT